MDKPASIEGLPLSILAKLPKEVKEISKYFKTTSSSQENKNNRKLYAQASKLGKKSFKVMVSPNQGLT